MSDALTGEREPPMDDSDQEYYVTFRVTGDVERLGKWLQGNSHIAPLVRVEGVDSDV